VAEEFLHGAGRAGAASAIVLVRTV
jgi:hypothetical protein